MNKTSQTVALAVLLLILAIGGYYFYQSKSKIMDTNQIINSEDLAKKEDYLDKNDPIYQLLAGRVMDDLKISAQKQFAAARHSFNMHKVDPENKVLREAKFDSFSIEEAQKITEQVIPIMENSINAYMVKTRLVDSLKNADGFYGALKFQADLDEFSKKDGSEISNQYNIGVLSIGNNEYIVEFWLDHSKIPTSLYAQSVIDGKPSDSPREEKSFSVWYTVSESRDVVFHDPNQEIEDFYKTL